MESFNYIDIAIVVLVLLSAIVGFIRGFVREAFSLASWIAAIVVAFLFYEKLATQLPFNIPNELARLGVSFLLLFIGVLVLGSLVNYLFNRAIHAIGLGGADRVLGGVFGVVRGSLVVTLLVLLMGLGLTSFTEHALWTSSKLVPHFVKTADWIKKEIPDNVADKIQHAATSLGLETGDSNPKQENSPEQINSPESSETSTFQ